MTTEQRGAVYSRMYTILSTRTFQALQRRVSTTRLKSETKLLLKPDALLNSLGPVRASVTTPATPQHAHTEG